MNGPVCSPNQRWYLSVGRVSDDVVVCAVYFDAVQGRDPLDGGVVPDRPGNVDVPVGRVPVLGTRISCSRTGVLFVLRLVRNIAPWYPHRCIHVVASLVEVVGYRQHPLGSSSLPS